MTKNESLLPINTLRKLVHLDCATGKLYWKSRVVECFSVNKRSPEDSQKTWNTRFANKEAFCTKQGMGYFHGSIFNQKYLAHRVVYALKNGHWPIGEVDHINGIKTDNRPENLRDVTHKNNMRNQKTRSTNTSGITGVSFDKRRNKYEAYICPDKKKITLGRYATKDEAELARSKVNEKFNFHENHGRSQQ